jgi:hypothetical protein
MKHDIRHFFLTLLMLLLAAVPLVSPVGRNLEYEYAFLLSILILTALPAMALLPVLRCSSLICQNPRLLLVDAMKLFALILAAAAAPALISFAAGTCRCSPPEFWLFFLLQGTPSLLLALFLHYLFSCLINSRTLRPLRCLMLFIALNAGAIGINLFMLWTEPQKRLISLVYGYMHGPIYDAWLPLDSLLMAARAVAALLFLLLFAGLAFRNHLKASRLVTRLILVTLGINFFLGQQPSLSNDKRTLDRALSGVIDEGDFALHYLPSFRGAATTDDVKQILLQARFHINELKPLFKSSFRKIHIYLYPDETRKKLWFGASDTDVTDVVTPSIHITFESWPHGSLRHELVHALASSSAFFGLGFHPNMALTEGLAMYLAPHENRVSLHEGAAAILSSGRLKNPAELFSPFFFTHSSARSYTLAGSLIKYLTDSYGFDKVLAIYAGKSWSSVYHKSLGQIVEQWQRFLTARFPHQHNLETEALYRYPGTLGDLCPHSKATLLQESGSDPILKLRQPAGWKPDRDYVPWRIQLDATDLRYQTLKLQTETRLALKESPDERQKNRLNAIRQAIVQLRSSPPKNIEDIELTLLLLDIDALTESSFDFERSFRELEESAARHQVGIDLMRQIEARRLAAQIPHEASRRNVRLFLLTGQKALLLKEQDSSWFYTYLLVRHGLFEKAHATPAAMEALISLPLPDSLPSFFALEWYKQLGHRFFTRLKFHHAALAYEKALSHCDQTSRESLLQYQRASIFLDRSGNK